MGNDKKSTVFSIRTKESTLEKIDKFARDHKRSRNDYLNILFEEHIEATENLL